MGTRLLIEWPRGMRPAVRSADRVVITAIDGQVSSGVLLTDPVPKEDEIHLQRAMIDLDDYVCVRLTKIVGAE